MMAATGRPRGADSRARRAIFISLVLDGMETDKPLDAVVRAAIRQARIKPERAAVIFAEIARPLIQRAA